MISIIGSLTRGGLLLSIFLMFSSVDCQKSLDFDFSFYDDPRVIYLGQFGSNQSLTADPNAEILQKLSLNVPDRKILLQQLDQQGIFDLSGHFRLQEIQGLIAVNDMDGARRVLKDIEVNELKYEDRALAKFYDAYIKFTSKEFEAARIVLLEVDTKNPKLQDATTYYLAFSEYYLKDFDKSLFYFNACFTTSFYHNDLHFYLASCYYQLNKNGNAIDELKSYLLSSETKNFEPEGKYLLAEIISLEKDSPLFENYIEDVERLNLSSERLWYELAHYYNRTNEKKSFEYYDKLLETNSPNAHIYLLEYAQIKLKDNAQECLNLMTRIQLSALNTMQKEQYDIMLNMANYKLKNWQQIVSGTKNLAIKHQFLTELSELRFVALYNMGNYEDFLENTKYYTLSNKYNHLVEQAHFFLGEKYVKTQNSKQAINHLNFVQNDDLYGSLAKYYLGRIYYLEGNNAKAISYLKQSRETNRDYLLAYTYYNSEDWKSALRYFESLPINDAEIIQRKAECLIKLKRYKESINMYQKLANMSNDGSKEHIITLANLYESTGDVSKAIETYEDYVMKNPKHISSILAMNKLIILYTEANEKKKAIDYCNKLLAHPNINQKQRDESLYRRGQLAYSDGDIDLAIKYLKSGLTEIKDPGIKEQCLKTLETIYITELNDPDSYFAIANQQGGSISNNDKEKIVLENIRQLYAKKDNRFEASAEEFIIDYPKSGDRKEILLLLAESYVVKKAYSKAISKYELLHLDHPNHETKKVLKSLTILNFEQLSNCPSASNYAKIYCEKYFTEKNSDFVAMYNIYITCMINNQVIANETFVQRMIPYLTSSSQLDKSYFLLGKLHEKNGNFEEAKTMYFKVSNQTIEQYGEAQYRIANILYTTDKIGQSSETIDKYINSDKAIDYWTAKCLILYSDIQILANKLVQAKAALLSIKSDYSGRSKNEILDEVNDKLSEISRLEKKSK